jgi:putative oxidoreductase
MVDVPVIAEGTTSPDRRERFRIDIALLVLRLGVATPMFLLHGSARLLRAFNYSFYGAPWPFVDLVAGLGFPMAGAFAIASALSESIGALLVGVGLFTRPAAAVLAIDMAVAVYNEISGGDSFELPALYFISAVALMITGPGRYALDTIRRRRPPR